MEHVAWGNCSTETDGSGKKSASKIVKSLRGRWVQPCYSLHFRPAAIFLHPHLSSHCYFHCCCSQSRCSLPAGPRCGLLLPPLLPLLPLSLAASGRPLSSPAPRGSSCGHCGSSPCRTPWGNTYVSACLLQPHFLREFSQTPLLTGWSASRRCWAPSTHSLCFLIHLQLLHFLNSGRQCWYWNMHVLLNTTWIHFLGVPPMLQKYNKEVNKGQLPLLTLVHTAINTWALISQLHFHNLSLSPLTIWTWHQMLQDKFRHHYDSLPASPLPVTRTKF